MNVKFWNSLSRNSINWTTKTID